MGFGGAEKGELWRRQLSIWELESEILSYMQAQGQGIDHWVSAERPL